MPRHCCCGLVDEESVCRKFSPQGEKAGAAPVIVQVEELETLCLKDIKGKPLLLKKDAIVDK